MKKVRLLHTVTLFEEPEFVIEMKAGTVVEVLKEYYNPTYCSGEVYVVFDGKESFSVDKTVTEPVEEEEEDENEPYRRCIDFFSDLEPDCCNCAELECQACEPVPEFYKAGDKVRKRNGMKFINGLYELTVKQISVYRGQQVIWVEELGDYIVPEEIELVP